MNVQIVWYFKLLKKSFVNVRVAIVAYVLAYRDVCLYGDVSLDTAAGHLQPSRLEFLSKSTISCNRYTGFIFVQRRYSFGTVT